MMTRRGTQQSAAGKTPQPRTLRARKRKFPGKEESAPTGDTETPQPEELHGSSVFKLTSSGLEERPTISTKASDSCSEVYLAADEVKPLQSGCTTAQKEGCPSFQAAGHRNVLHQGVEAEQNCEAHSDTKYVIHPALVHEKSFSDNERATQKQYCDSHVEAALDASLRKTHYGDGALEASEIQEPSAAMLIHSAQRPLGSPQTTCDGSEVGKRPNTTDGMRGRDGEQERESQHAQVIEGTGDCPNAQPDHGEGRGTGSDAEQLRSAMGGQYMDIPTKKKVRRRMGMWGFGERERLNRCEGQFGGGRNLKKGVSEVERQKDGNDSKNDEGPEFDGCKVTEKIREIPNMAANNTDCRANKVIVDSKWDLVSQPGMSPPIPDICTPSPPIPMDSAPTEKEPTQPKMEGHCSVAGQPVLLGKTVTGATKTSPSALHTKKTVRSDPGPPVAEQGAAASPAVRDRGRGTGNPCAVQEEDFDLSITPLEKEPGGQGRQAGPREVWGHPSSEQRVSPGPTPLEDETAGGLGGGDGCASPQGTPALDENLFGVIQAPDDVEGHGAAVVMGAAWSEPQSLGMASESLEHVGLGLPQDYAMLSASDQPDVNPNQHLHREDDALVNRDTGSEYGGPGHTEYTSVFPTVCEDSTLPLETELEQKFSAQYVSVSGCMSRPSTVQSPKPREEPDFDPDSVSDSQLNNITLSEMEDLPAPDSAEGDQQEDASELVCGLIKELSSLNRTVMAAHRELENLRRSNKTSKLPLRRPYGSRRNEV